MPAAVTPALIEAIERAGPFGQGAPAPRFAFADMQIRHARRIGENHLRIAFSDGISAPVEAVAFGAFDTPLGPLLSDHGGRPMHLAGRLELNHWQGRTRPQLRLEDAARA